MNTYVNNTDMTHHYQRALDVQDACNLSGVVRSFWEAMQALGDAGLDTDARNTHPIAILYADKIAHLTGTQTLCHPVALRAYDDCYKALGQY